MKALLVVDLQNDFLPHGALAVPQSDGIVSLINNVQEAFDCIVATQDWHPQYHQSFASQHPEHQVFDKIVLHGQDQVLWPDHCVQGTEGADFSPLWNSDRVQAVFRKGMDERIDSYSGFYDNGHAHSTGLSGYLKELGVKEVFIAGLAADFCVYYTALDAQSEGFKTYYLEFATCAIHNDTYQAAKIKMKQEGIVLVNTKEELACYV